MGPKVSIVTAATGHPLLERNLASVAAQDYSGPLQHLVVVDGPQREAAVRARLRGAEDVLVLPYPTGLDGFNGHRIYGAAAFLAEGEWLIHLDEDNFLTANHVSSLVQLVTDQSLQWAFALRQIHDAHGFVCNDDCESLGLWPSILHHEDYFVDVNCYFLSRAAALAVAPLWYTRTRQPGQPEVDRQLAAALRHHFPRMATTGNYSVGYQAGSTERSVRPEFFLQGNQLMLERFQGRLPWKNS